MINDIPLFDSLTHPSVDGSWMVPNISHKNTAELLLESMHQYNIRWALSVNMGAVTGNYSDQQYADFIAPNSKKLFPIAYLNVDLLRGKNQNQLQNHFERLVIMGYIGVKLHPRFSDFTFSDPFIAQIIRLASIQKLTILLCTYCWGKTTNAISNTPQLLMTLLNQVQDCNIILLHGGNVLLLQYMEIARTYANVLLDLSFTLAKYQGTSLDLDIQYLFSQFDRRICVGSDSPEFSPEKLRERFEFFCIDLTELKKRNIAYQNLFNFMPLLKKQMPTVF